MIWHPLLAGDTRSLAILVPRRRPQRRRAVVSSECRAVSPSYVGTTRGAPGPRGPNNGRRPPHYGDSMGWATGCWHQVDFDCVEEGDRPMSGAHNLGRSPVAFCEGSTLIAVVEMSQSSWLVAGLLPGIERPPLKRLAADQDALLSLLHRWRDEAEKAGCPIRRICVAYEAGPRRLLAGALVACARGIEAHVMHASSIPVKRDHRRAGNDWRGRRMRRITPCFACWPRCTGSASRWRTYWSPSCCLATSPTGARWRAMVG